MSCRSPMVKVGLCIVALASPVLSSSTVIRPSPGRSVTGSIVLASLGDLETRMRGREVSRVEELARCSSACAMRSAASARRSSGSWVIGVEPDSNRGRQGEQFVV